MGDFRIKTCVLGMVSTNCYIVYHGKEAVIIDPADNAEYIRNQCRELGVEPRAVLLTHGHFDHILAVKDLLACPLNGTEGDISLKVYAGEREEALIQDPSLNLSATFGHGFSARIDRPLKDGEAFELLGTEWRVIATPGHTAGSVCYLVEEEEVLFSGDTLFAESLGRTDFPTGSPAEIVRSIVDKLFVLRDDIMVYPGHGEATTIGHEKQHNPAAQYRR